MRSFRQKVFLSYIILLLLFLGLMFPFVTNSVQQIVFHSMSECADELIEDLTKAKDEEELIQILKDHKAHLFYRVGILDNQRRLLYDSHTKRLTDTPLFPLRFVTHPEIEAALRCGVGYAEEYSHLLGQKLIYVAKRFEFRGQPHVIRLAFPFQFIEELRGMFTGGVLLFGALVLVLFSVVAALVLNHLSSPIREIIQVIRKYREGNLETLPNIRLKTAPQDDFTHLANTINSLSQQVRAEIESVRRERNEREAILESLTDGVIAVDSALTVSYANNTALKYLGTTSEIVGDKFPETLSPECFRLLEKCCQNKTLVVDELEVKREGLHLSIMATPRQYDGGALLVFHDKSQQYRMLEMRKAFIANASHELKTPITVIRGFAETLYDHTDLPQETISKITERIMDNCKKMTLIIKNLLTIADIENLPSFRVVSCSLIDLVTGCMKTAQSIWADAQIELVKDEKDSFKVEVDSGLLEVAVANLLDNAAKYSEGPASIQLRLGRRGQYVAIEVEDRGIGIPHNELENVFQRFYRVNKARSSKTSGSGLGLSIVETIVHKHLGRIEVRSEVGKGSAFTILIPENLQTLLQASEKK